MKRPRKPQPPIEVSVEPPDKPDPERTGRVLRGLHELAEQILAREAREREKEHERDDAA